MEIPISVTAHNEDHYIRYCVEWKIHVSVTAYKWIDNEYPHPKHPLVAAAGRENRELESDTAYNGNPYTLEQLVGVYTCLLGFGVQK